MRRKLITTVLVLLVFLGLVGVGTLAVFNDSDSVGANTFTTGTVSLSTSPTTAAISFNNMLPGDRVTDDIVVTNDAGSAQLRYALSSVATNADSKGLKDQLSLIIKSGVTGATPCANFDSSGTVIYSGDLDSSAGKLVGDSAQGAQAGDRTLAVNASETLCFRAELPLSTGNAFKSATTTATLTFDSEQTANNP